MSMAMAGRIEAARAQRNSYRDNFRMFVIRSHLGHLERFARASMPAQMTTTCGCSHFHLEIQTRTFSIIVDDLYTTMKCLIVAG